MGSTDLLLNHRELNNSALKLLLWLNSIGLVLQVTVLLTVTWFLHMPLPLSPLAMIIVAQVIWNTLLWYRIRQPGSASTLEVALNLAIDLIALAALFYFTGGSTNPFISLFIVPIALAAVFLPARPLAALLVLSVTLYTVLLEWYHPLPPLLHDHAGSDFHLHVVGMWANYIFSALIISVFVYVLAHSVRKYQLALSAAREKLLRNQHIVKVGMLAASAAHEMNTPLSSIRMLAAELAETAPDEQAAGDAREIARQVDFCQAKLVALQGQADDAAPRPLADALDDLLATWLASRPEIELHKQIQLDGDALLPAELASVITNLLDNAADASLKAGNTRISLAARLENGQVIVDIDDQGHGLSEQQIASLGKTAFSDKPDGMGLGLMLSHASLDHLNGQLRLLPLQPRGIRARINFPSAA